MVFGGRTRGEAECEITKNLALSCLHHAKLTQYVHIIGIESISNFPRCIYVYSCRLLIVTEKYALLFLIFNRPRFLSI